MQTGSPQSSHVPMFVLLVALNVAHSKHNARCDLVAGITASAAPLATCAHACAAAGSDSGLGIGFFFFGFAASPARLLHLVAAFVEEVAAARRAAASLRLLEASFSARMFSANATSRLTFSDASAASRSPAASPPVHGDERPAASVRDAIRAVLTRRHRMMRMRR